MDASTEYAQDDNELNAVIDPLELEDFGTIIDDEYISRWNNYVESADIDDWDEDDQTDADAIAASVVFTEDGWQKHFMRRMISDVGGLEIDWQNPEISKFKAEVEGKPAISELIDRELDWWKNMN